MSGSSQCLHKQNTFATVCDPRCTQIPKQPQGHEKLRDPGKKKTNKHKHFGWDGVWDKQDPSLGQAGPLPGANWDPSLGQTGRFLLNSTVESPFCPVCPWDGWVPGTIVPQGQSEKCLCVFCLLVFFFAPRHKRDVEVWRVTT